MAAQRTTRSHKPQDKFPLNRYTDRKRRDLKYNKNVGQEEISPSSKQTPLFSYSSLFRKTLKIRSTFNKRKQQKSQDIFSST